MMIFVYCHRIANIEMEFELFDKFFFVTERKTLNLSPPSNCQSPIILSLLLYQCSFCSSYQSFYSFSSLYSYFSSYTPWTLFIRFTLPLLLLYRSSSSPILLRYLFHHFPLHSSPASLSLSFSRAVDISAALIFRLSF